MTWRSISQRLRPTMSRKSQCRRRARSLNGYTIAVLSARPCVHPSSVWVPSTRRLYVFFLFSSCACLFCVVVNVQSWLPVLLFLEWKKQSPPWTETDSTTSAYTGGYWQRYDERLHLIPAAEKKREWDSKAGFVLWNSVKMTRSLDKHAFFKMNFITFFYIQTVHIGLCVLCCVPLKRLCFFFCVSHLHPNSALRTCT